MEVSGLLEKVKVVGKVRHGFGLHRHRPGDPYQHRGGRGEKREAIVAVVVLKLLHASAYT